MLRRQARSLVDASAAPPKDFVSWERERWQIDTHTHTRQQTDRQAKRHRRNKEHGGGGWSVYSFQINSLRWSCAARTYHQRSRRTGSARGYLCYPRYPRAPIRKGAKMVEVCKAIPYLIEGEEPSVTSEMPDDGEYEYEVWEARGPRVHKAYYCFVT